MVLILPTAMIQRIVSGEIVDFFCIPADPGQFCIDFGRGIAQDWTLDSAELFSKLERAIVDDDCAIDACTDILHCEGSNFIPWWIAPLAQSVIRVPLHCCPQLCHLKPSHWHRGTKALSFDLKMSLRDIAEYFSRDCTEHNWVYLRHCRCPDCCKLLPCIDP